MVQMIWLVSIYLVELAMNIEFSLGCYADRKEASDRYTMVTKLLWGDQYC